MSENRSSRVWRPSTNPFLDDHLFSPSRT
jgi:hypothetical protein